MTSGRRSISLGCVVALRLILGTGPGTQAMQLAQRGFDVTATDISAAAIRLAREKAEAQGLTISWLQDDILSTRLTGPFDLIFDRGCFHVLPPERRQDYVATVAGLLKPGGYFFLKCFSHLQPGTQGPNRFTPEQIQAIFSRQLAGAFGQANGLPGHARSASTRAVLCDAASSIARCSHVCGSTCYANDQRPP